MQIPQKLIIKQQVEALEIFTKFETKNKYRILDESNKDLFYAYEESNFFARNFFKTHRPLKIVIIDKSQKPKLVIKRSFFFIRPHYTIENEKGKTLGHIDQTTWWHAFKFNVFKEDNLLFECNAHVKHPWTFKILSNKQEVGQIAKKWSGAGKEMFTDTDNFILDFNIANNEERQLLLATALAIDVTRFETK